ncbi:MAG: hypothetical protein KBI20_08380 [Sedimentibacter sp.]|jgi:hypothetical protein|nr:hypothetical protein [Sedimentibacter sp.]
MELLEYLDIIEKKLKNSFDIKRNYTLNNIQFDMFAEYHLRNERYVLVKKAVVYAFENNEYSFIKYCGKLDKDYLQKVINTLTDSVQSIVKPDKEHMSSTITLVIVTENFINNKDKDVITKIISKFKYNKGFAFGFKGWADIRLVLVSLNEDFMATNKKGKEVIELYGVYYKCISCDII